MLTDKLLQDLLSKNDPSFWQNLAIRSQAASSFEDLLFLSKLRRKALSAKFFPEKSSNHKPLRVAFIGGYNSYPLHEFVEHLLFVRGIPCELFIGNFDNYVQEITDTSSELYQSKPEVVLLLPSHNRCRYLGKLSDSREQQDKQAIQTSQELLQLCKKLHESTQAEILLGNFLLPAQLDPGSYRAKTLGSDWSFRKRVNLELGLNVSSYVHIWDLEFLGSRRGNINAWDARAWFESKQPCSSELLVDLAQEAAHIVHHLRTPSKKALILDLDNTLWGGIVGDDGWQGLELGDTSPRGGAFKAFQSYVLSLSDRGVLLAVCSKNDPKNAMEAFQKHPEMVLRMEHFASFKANWDPKTDNIREIATELGIGLDSLVFADDNPAEIEIVRQFAPEVSLLLLGPDPANYIQQLQNSRFFEVQTLTEEDSLRASQYRQEMERKKLLHSVTDMDAYLASLEMVGTIEKFNDSNLPRIVQLINKSNQFNLTTRRRTEAEVQSLINDPSYICITMRLKDKFGDHGLISAVIAKVNKEIEIDTWIMSCRVLKRQVEDALMNELMRFAKSKSCLKARGLYLPTPKNEMVRDFFPSMGFQCVSEAKSGDMIFECEIGKYKTKPTKIHLQEFSWNEMK